MRCKNCDNRLAEEQRRFTARVSELKTALREANYYRDGLADRLAAVLPALTACVAGLKAIDSARHEPQNDTERAAVAELKRLIEVGERALHGA